MRPLQHRRRQERGVVGIVGAGVCLPLVVLLVVSVVDLSRAPIAMRDIRDALMRGAYAGEEILLDSTTPANSPGLSANIPAAHNFCLNNNNTSNPPANCDVADGVGQDFLVPAIAQKIVTEACAFTGEALSQGIGLFKYGTIGVEFRVVKVAVDASTGVAPNAAPTTIATSGDACSGHGSFSALAAGRATAAVVSQNFAAAFSGSEFGWNIESWDDANQTNTTTFLAPYLLVGVAYVEPGYFFSYFGGTDVSVGDYFIRTVNNVAGMQRK